MLKEHPHIIVVGCTPHSFNLCSSYACQKLPKDVDVLGRDIYSHFAHSSKRVNILKEFQSFWEFKPHKIIKHNNNNKVARFFDSLQYILLNIIHSNKNSRLRWSRRLTSSQFECVELMGSGDPKLLCPVSMNTYNIMI